MTDQQIISAFIGLFMPILVSLVVRASWSDAAKEAVSLLSCAVVGAIVVYMSGGFNGISTIGALWLLFVATKASFQLYWHNSGVVAWLTAHVFGDGVIPADPPAQIAIVEAPPAMPPIGTVMG